MAVRLTKYRTEMRLTGSHPLSKTKMNFETQLLKAFEFKGVACGQELIVFKEFCNDFIKTSKRSGLAVIGIEGFHLLQNGSIKPNMDEIADFSDVEADVWEDYIEKCTTASENFIRQMLVSGKSDGYCFTLTDSID
jgi:fructose-1-phosphate kinase PfkB-like protein